MSDLSSAIHNTGHYRVRPRLTPQALKTFARKARTRMRTESGGYRRDHLRALAQRVEVDAKEVRIMGSKSVLLRARRGLKRKIGGFWRAQFCTELARPERFELRVRWEFTVTWLAG